MQKFEIQPSGIFRKKFVEIEPGNVTFCDAISGEVRFANEQMPEVFEAIGCVPKARIATLTAELAAKSLTWTTEKPIVEGYYWHQSEFYDSTFIIEINKKRAADSAWLTPYGCFEPIQLLEGKFAGPISQPSQV
jgi:hypothetical protein